MSCPESLKRVDSSHCIVVNRLSPFCDAVAMWKVLGKDCLYIDIAKAWTERILELSVNYEKADEFKKLMEESEVFHLFDATLETHNFMIEVPKDYTPEQIQTMADVILSIAKDNIDTPFVEIEGKYQKSNVIISNEDEPELIGSSRSDGYGSGKIFLPILTSLTQPGRMNESMLD